MAYLYRPPHRGASAHRAPPPRPPARGDGPRRGGGARARELLWVTEELRRTKPTVEDEVKGALYYLPSSLWSAQARLVQRIEAVLTQAFGRRFEAASPVRTRSWIRGDRNGNPAVTPKSRPGRRTTPAASDPTLLGEMHDGWSFFRSLLEGAELSLAKTDLEMTPGYLRLVDPELAGRFFSVIERAHKAALAAMEEARSRPLLADAAALARSLELRNPYLHPINHLQIQLLYRYRRLPPRTPTANRRRGRSCRPSWA